MGRGGLEPPHESLIETGVSHSGGAESGASMDDLARVIKAWPSLSAETRVLILSLIR